MPTIPPIETKKKLDTLSIRKQIKALKLLGEEGQLTPLTDTDIKVFKKLLNKRNLSDNQDETFNDAAKKILYIFSLYDELVSQFLSQGKFNRRQLKVLLEQSYWQKIVEAYEQEYDFDLNGLDASDKSKISPIQKEHMKYAQQAILCLLDVKDFSHNLNFKNDQRLASLAKFDDRYFQRHEVKQLLEKDQTLFTEVLNFYPTDHEISELKGKYSYVNHFFALVDYHRALPKMSDAVEIDAPGYPSACSDGVNSSFEKELSPGAQSPGLGFLPGHPHPEELTPAKRLVFPDTLTPIPGTNRSKNSSSSSGHINDASFSSFLGGRCPEEQEHLELQLANLHARASVLPNIVRPDSISDRKKLAQLQRYFIEFLLSNSDTRYLNMFILDACLLNEEIENCYLEENVDKNFAFDFLTKNRVLLLKMLNLSAESSDPEMSTSVLSKAISTLSTNNLGSSKGDWRHHYGDIFSTEEIDPCGLEGLVTQLLAHELNHNEQVFSRMFSALSYFEPKISAENKKKWLNLLIELALNKPDYATKLLDRRYCFKWFSQQAKAFLEIADIKQILLGSRHGESGNKRYNDAQISLVFSRRFFYLLKPDAMKFSGEDLIDLLEQGHSDSLGRAIATKPYYLRKILHALNDLNINGDTAKITATLTHILQFYPSIFDCLEKEYPEFSRGLNKGAIEVFVFPERIELGSNQQSHPATGIKVERDTTSATPNKMSSRTPILHRSILTSSANTPVKTVLEDVLEADEKSPHREDSASVMDSGFSAVDGQHRVADPVDEAVIPTAIAEGATTSEQPHFIQGSSAPVAPPFSSPLGEQSTFGDSSVVSEAMVAVTVRSEQAHFIQGSSAPVAPPFSSPLGEQSTSDDSSVVPEAMVAVTVSSEQPHFIQGSSAPVAPPFSSPLGEQSTSDDSSVVPEAMVAVTVSSEQPHFIQGSSAPVAPPFSSPLGEQCKSGDSSILAEVVPEAVVAVATTADFIQGASAPAVPPFSSPLTGLGNTSLCKEKEVAAPSAATSSSTAPKPEFLAQISSGRDMFFSKIKQQKAELQTVLQRIFFTHNIWLKDGLVEEKFIIELQRTNSREAAIRLMEAHLMMKDGADAQPNPPAEAHDSFDSSVSDSPSSPAKSIPITGKRCKVVVASFAAEWPAFKNWADNQDLVAETPAKSEVPTLTLMQLMQRMRKVLKSDDDDDDDDDDDRKTPGIS